MLILPLHRPLTRATFPFATALLVLLNVFVFFGLQGDDEAAMRVAAQHYVESGLAELEAPAFERHLQRSARHDDLQQLRRLPDEGRARHIAEYAATDVAFLAAMREGQVFASAAEHASWQALRPAYDVQLGRVFTLQHLMRSSEPDPWRMFASAFLHADVAHLLGNLLFLTALGLLVEGSLGAGRFLGVYAVGALGSSAFALLWRWGESGGGLGASGAVAALMGAFCVIWGRQPVRFFYWFGVVFDYVRAPAIWLLPAWLGWEVFNLLANPHAGIGFDAHAGGLLTGAMAGAALVATGQVRSAFIRDDASGAIRDDRWERAMAHLGRMQLREADALLEELATEQPGRFDVRLARYRAACNGGQARARTDRALELLALPESGHEAIAAQRGALRDLQELGVQIPVPLRTELISRWLAAGMPDACEAVLTAFPQASEEDAQLWFRTALGYGEGAGATARARVLRALIERHPHQPLAQKARFLLDNA